MTPEHLKEALLKARIANSKAQAAQYWAIEALAEAKALCNRYGMLTQLSQEERKQLDLAYWQEYDRLKETSQH